MIANVLQIWEAEDCGAQNCQASTYVDARKNVQLTPEPQIS